MPAGLVASLTDGELRDLLAFLTARADRVDSNVTNNK